MTRLFSIALLLLFGLVQSRGVEAASYYFSAAGDDLLGDGSMERPWNSVARFNSLQLRPGDGAFFRSGDTFTGTVRLDSADSAVDAQGRLVAPISIGSYGGGKATIRSPFNAEGMVVHNAGGIELSDLDFLSGGFSSGGRTNGVQFMADLAATSSRSKLEHIRVSNVTARDFGLNGLQVWAHQTVGFEDVQVTDSEFSGNGYSGMYLGASQYTLKPHANVTVDRVVAHNNPGYVGAESITGHGVIMANVDGGLLQNSVASDNGKVNGNLNVGLWTYQSNAVTIQHNLAYGNRSPGGLDGGAFDIDGGATNSVVQYNVSFDNDGAGLLLAEYQSQVAMGQNAFRHNFSLNDGRDGYGGITIVGNPTRNPTTGQIGWAQNTVFQNNTIVSDKAVVPNSKGSVYLWNEHYRNIDFFDNSFVSLNGADLIAGKVSPSRADLSGNAYWTDGSGVRLKGVQGQSTGLTTNALGIDAEAWGLVADDYDFDGDVDPVDYLVFRDIVDLPAYSLWRDRLGVSNPAASMAVVAIPEPSAVVLSMMLLGAMTCRFTHGGRRHR